MNDEHKTGQNISADDLKFMRSAVEKRYRPLRPETHDSVIWGFIISAVYIGIHFLIKHKQFGWINPYYLTMMAIGICSSLVTLHFLVKRMKRDGFFPVLLKQVAWIWIIIFFPIFFWERMGLFKNIFCGAGFMYAMGMCILLGVFGVMHSKRWFIGSVMAFSGMVLAYIIKDSAFLILGLSVGPGTIISALLVDREYKEQGTENAKV